MKQELESKLEDLSPLECCFFTAIPTFYGWLIQEGLQTEYKLNAGYALVLSGMISSVGIPKFVSAISSLEEETSLRLMDKIAHLGVVGSLAGSLVYYASHR